FASQPCVPPSRFKPKANTISDSDTFLTSIGFGSYSCGSIPLGTRLCTSTCSPPIASAISVIIVNEDAICNLFLSPESTSEHPAKMSVTAINMNHFFIEITYKYLAISPRRGATINAKTKIAVATTTMDGPLDKLKLKLKNSPTIALIAPIAADKNIIVDMRCVSKYAVDAGVMSNETTRITPTVCSDTTVTSVNMSMSR